MSSVNADHAWEAVLSRDRRGDRRFVYVVSSTSVYCCPSCPSRRPSPDHVMFFDSPKRAESVGYRACLRWPEPVSAIPSRSLSRVIGLFEATDILQGYRWGLERKQRLLALERT